MYVKDKLKRGEKVGVAPFMYMGSTVAYTKLLLDSMVLTPGFYLSVNGDLVGGVDQTTVQGLARDRLTL